LNRYVIWVIWHVGRVIGRPVRRRVSKGVEDGRRPPTVWAGHPRNGRKVVLGVACPQGVEGSGMAGPGKTLPLAIRAW